MIALSIAWREHLVWLAILVLVASYGLLYAWVRPRPVVEPYLAQLTKGLEKGRYARPVFFAQRWTSDHRQIGPTANCTHGAGKSGWRSRQRRTAWTVTPSRSAISVVLTGSGNGDLTVGGDAAGHGAAVAALRGDPQEVRDGRVWLDRDDRAGAGLALEGVAAAEFGCRGECHVSEDDTGCGVCQGVTQ